MYTEEVAEDVILPQGEEDGLHLESIEIDKGTSHPRSRADAEERRQEREER